jgi:phage-related protein
MVFLPFVLVVLSFVILIVGNNIIFYYCIALICSFWKSIRETQSKVKKKVQIVISYVAKTASASSRTIVSGRLPSPVRETRQVVVWYLPLPTV